MKIDDEVKISCLSKEAVTWEHEVEINGVIKSEEFRQSI